MRIAIVTISCLYSSLILSATSLHGAPPVSEMGKVTTISWKPPLYHGWPTLCQRRNGELLLAFSGGREAHVCPFGRLELMRSTDQGLSWKWPQVIWDSPIDDRDAGILETSKGTILITNFTSLAYTSLLLKGEKLSAGMPGAWNSVKLAEWRAAHSRLTAEQQKQLLGTWMIRSTDDGTTWSAPYQIPVNSPHGPVNLKDGRLLYCGIELWKAERRAGVCLSADDGLTWDWIATLPVRAGDLVQNYHELHAIETSQGSWVVQIRNHNPSNLHEILQTESHDQGKSWSEPHPIGVWGLPSHLLRLKNDNLLMTYGHRRKPLGCMARLSTDHAKSWSEPIELYTEGHSTDLGYPSTVELSDGELITVWYELLPGSPNAQLRQLRWKLLPEKAN